MQPDVGECRRQLRWDVGPESVVQEPAGRVVGVDVRELVQKGISRRGFGNYNIGISPFSLMGLT
jgi:hypothetical protein